MPRLYENDTRTFQRLVGATCDKCATRIGVNGAGSLDGGMVVEADGWFGGLIDPILTVLEVVLCDGCGGEFMDEYFPSYGGE